MLRSSIHELCETEEIGDFAFSDDETQFWFVYKNEINSTKGIGEIPISKIPLESEKPYWLWDGNKEEPTFIPSPQSTLVSIRLYTNEGDIFHKSMVKGKWV